MPRLRSRRIASPIHHIISSVDGVVAVVPGEDQTAAPQQRDNTSISSCSSPLSADGFYMVPQQQPQRVTNAQQPIIDLGTDSGSAAPQHSNACAAEAQQQNIFQLVAAQSAPVAFGTAAQRCVGNAVQRSGGGSTATSLFMPDLSGRAPAAQPPSLESTLHDVNHSAVQRGDSVDAWTLFDAYNGNAMPSTAANTLSTPRNTAAAALHSSERCTADDHPDMIDWNSPAKPQTVVAAAAVQRSMATATDVNCQLMEEMSRGNNAAAMHLEVEQLTNGLTGKRASGRL